MADLSDYLGHLLCEITRARVMADNETVRTAHRYVGDGNSLLKNFPVPRMRLPNVEITVPAVINDLPDGYVETTRTDPKLFARMLIEDLGPALKKQGIRIDTAEATRIILDDAMLSKGLLPADLPDILGAKLYDTTKAEKKPSGDAPEGATSAERFRTISSIIRKQIAKTIEALPRKPVGIAVDPRTAAVKEVGGPGLVADVKLIIREDSMEILLEDELQKPAGPEDLEPPPGRRPIIRKLVPE